MLFPIKQWRLSKQHFLFKENCWVCLTKSCISLQLMFFQVFSLEKVEVVILCIS